MANRRSPFWFQPNSKRLLVRGAECFYSGNDLLPSQNYTKRQAIIGTITTPLATSDALFRTAVGSRLRIDRAEYYRLNHLRQLLAECLARQASYLDF